MDLYPQLKEAASDLDEAEFSRRHGGIYFFCRMPGSRSSALPFVTQVHSISPSGKIAGEPEDGGPPERLYKLKKSLRNSWRGRISVGRAKNNDIVIRHNSVSKLHAHFSDTGAASTRPEADANHQLTDAGSSNGTTVNDTALNTDIPAPIGNRDRVAFGQISGRILDANTLHTELVALDWF